MPVASLVCLKYTGVSPGLATDSSKRPNFVSVDEHEPVSGNAPVSAPIDLASSPNSSFENYLRWKCTARPENQIINFKAYGPPTQPDAGSSPANKVTVYWATTDTYTQPSADVSVVATTPQHSNYYDGSSALAIGLTEVDDKIDAVDETTDFLVAQVQVVFGAAQGTVPDIVNAVTYEES